MEFNAEKTLNAIIPTLFEARYQLSRGSALYAAIEGLTQQCAQDLFGPNALQKANIAGIGDIYFPYRSFGTINTVHQFGLDELILFSFYYFNRRNYKTVVDIGANIGLHSTILAKLGYHVVDMSPILLIFRSSKKR